MKNTKKNIGRNNILKHLKTKVRENILNAIHGGKNHHLQRIDSKMKADLLIKTNKARIHRIIKILRENNYQFKIPHSKKIIYKS